jgi:hypothetical protein
MRNGGFLIGQGCSLLDDFRRVPRFIAGFVLRPVDFVTAQISSPASTVEPEAGL